jgi:hypothetical protein
MAEHFGQCSLATPSQGDAVHHPWLNEDPQPPGRSLEAAIFEGPRQSLVLRFGVAQ